MTSTETSLKDLSKRIAEAMQADRFRLRRALRWIEQAQQAGKPVDRKLSQMMSDLDRSIAVRRRREDNAPRPDFDLDLPILARREEIGAAIRDHQVVVICGETGSGKSTQLPKICLDIGRGIDGFIGHTQPRRVAARTIAARLADELRSPLGEHVGFQIRFTDTTKPHTFIKLMTDGILLAETQGDRFLDRYDTIILDEAHERSLNIDFLMGYLKRLLPKRRDLRVIITSATIDAESFAAHFCDADRQVPIIEVSGRTYPVEVRYRPAEIEDEEEPPSIADQVAGAAKDLCGEGPGDILVFLPTERDILEVAKSLRGRSFAGSAKTHILPLYARLSTAEQNKVFTTAKHRRIVLATNVAESSLTVPGIRYVIDTGTARISRYAARSKVQRLPIEAVSRASADQRKGRCGRVGPGICIRLYSEDDFTRRDEYTTPEIRRTNLASVILRMLALRLGAVDEFPFLDPPRPEAISDGYKTLFELGAIDEHRKLTDIGQKLSRLPIDPRVGRMILAGDAEGCLHEMLIIASALEVQDPRDRPIEKKQQADEAHSKFANEESDFLTYLNLWDFYHGLREKLSRSQLRKACQQSFLSLVRLHEWQDVHRQLLQLCRENGIGHAKITLPSGGSRGTSGEGLHPKRTSIVRNRRPKPSPAATASDPPMGRVSDDNDAIHRALLTGLLSNIAMLRNNHEYEGAGGTYFYLWPGSSLFKQNPKWIVAGEAVETSQRYLRTIGRIKPEWIEPLADHLVKRTYNDPFWSRKSGTVLAYEKVTLFGLTLVSGRRTPYAHIEPVAARHLFIQHALVEGDFNSQAKFLVHNRRLLDDIQSLGDRARATDYLIGDGPQYAFYDERLSEEVFDNDSLNRWIKAASPAEKRRLQMTMSDLIGGDATTDDSAFPSEIDAGTMKLDIGYRFQPGDEDDGLTITLPKEGLQQLDERQLEWLVPGRVEEKLAALIRSLPKALRTSLIPAPDVARKAAEQMTFAEGDFLVVAARTFSKLGGEQITPGAFDLTKLPYHLRMNVRVVDDSGKMIAESRELTELKQELGLEASPGASVISDEAWERDEIKTWDFGELAESVEIRRGDFVLQAYPSLVDAGESASLRLAPTAEAAEQQTRAGLRRLFCIVEHRELKSQVHWLPQIEQMQVFAATLKHKRDLREQLIDVLAELSFLQGQPLPRNADEFDAARKRGRQQMLVVVQELAKLAASLFERYHEAKLKFDETASTKFAASIDDVRSQLTQLTREGFLTETPWPWLQHYPRYLRGITDRLEKLRTGGGARDQQAMNELAPHQQRIDEHFDKANAAGEASAALIEYRWMVEELRVSLFAQQLGTSIKVSAQRLEKQWAKV